MAENDTKEQLRYAQQIITTLQNMVNERTAQAVQLEAKVKCLLEDIEQLRGTKDAISENKTKKE